MEYYSLPNENWCCILRHLINTSAKDAIKSKLVCRLFFKEIDKIAFGGIKISNNVLAYFRTSKNLRNIERVLLQAKKDPSILDSRDNFPQTAALNIRAMIIGGERVGKTTFLLSYVHERYTQRDRHPSDMLMKTSHVTFKDHPFAARFSMIDALDSERFHSIESMYYRNANVVMLFFSLDDPNSLADLLQRWLGECYNNRDKMDDGVYYCIVGLKSELAEPNSPLSRQAKLLAYDLNMSYFEASSAENQNVVQTMNEIHLNYRALSAERNRMQKLGMQRTIEAKANNLSAFYWKFWSIFSFESTRSTMFRVIAVLAIIVALFLFSH